MVKFLPDLKCYMCEGDATSNEHVPPKNLFPEQKDLHSDYRKNLVTVPSCDLHNTAKSCDDEFLLVSLAGIIGNNSIGYRHRFTKVDRTLKRTSHRLLEKVIVNKKALINIELKNNRFISVIWGTPDKVRLDSCFEHIAMGVHFHHFDRRFVGKVKIHLDYLSHEGGNAKVWSEFLRDRVEVDLVGKTKYGENPEVFYYQVTDFDEFGLFLMKFCFYGGLNVFATFIHSEAKSPSHLGYQLMNLGVETVLSLGNKTYTINGR